MIVQKHFKLSDDGWELVKTRSDAGLKIRQVETGIVYDDAVDVMPCRYSYEETDEPIPTPEPMDADVRVSDLQV